MRSTLISFDFHARHVPVLFTKTRPLFYHTLPPGIAGANYLFGYRSAVNPIALFPSLITHRQMKRALHKFDSYLPNGYTQKTRQRLLQQIAELTVGAFRESNRQTAELTGLDLEKWRYEL